MAKMIAYPQHAENRTYDLEASQTFIRGAAVVLDASEEVTECGADPAEILGFAAHDAGVDPDTTKMIVHLADDETARFWIAGDDDPAKADINQEYGITKDGDGIWHLDGTKTGADARLYVHEIDTDRNLYKVSVLAANRQVAP